MWSLLDQKDCQEKTKELTVEERKEVARFFLYNSREKGIAPSATVLMRRYPISRRMAVDLLKESAGEDHEITGNRDDYQINIFTCILHE